MNNVNVLNRKKMRFVRSVEAQNETCAAEKKNSFCRPKQMSQEV